MTRSSSRRSARRLRELAALVALSAAAAGCGGSHRPAAASALPVVVLDSPSAPAWVRLLRSVGYAAHDGDLAALLGRSAGVVPADAPLAAGDRARIAAWVARGGRVATASVPLLARLGVAAGPPVRARGARMTGLAVAARWAAPLGVRPLAGEGLHELASADPGGGVVMAAARHGSGEVVGLAVDPAGAGRQGWELLPQAASLVGQRLGAPRGPRAQAAEVYVDPGALPGGPKTPPARIADELARAGARVAQVAGWNYDFTDPRNDYDYGALIRALHARGILAYAWLEPPFVTLALWQQHPECRERTQTGRDAKVDWRSLIALEDPRCLQLAEASWRRVLTRYPWDGVDVAELYFEPPTKADHFTPFSRAALRLFGRDPAKDPNGFLAFRVALVTRLNGDVLHFVSTLPRARHLGLELTVIDDTLDPALGRGVGSDVRALARVAAHAGASLVVEDPHTAWSEGPLRYDRLGPHVAKLMPPQDALVDVNVVPRYADPPPTAQMTGAELGLAVGSAAAPLGRIGVYSLGTLTPQDVAELPGAMAAGTSTTDLGVYGRWTVTVTAPSRRDGRLAVDGVAWPAAAGTAVVPAGNHVLEWSAGRPAGPGLAAFTGQLGTAHVSRRGLGFSYVTRPDGLAVVTERPTSLRVDGEAAPLRVVVDPAGGFVVRLPQGTHTVELGF